MKSENEKPNLEPSNKYSLEGMELVTLYQDENTLIRANRYMNKADGEAIQRLVINLEHTLPKNKSNPAA